MHQRERDGERERNWSSALTSMRCCSEREQERASERESKRESARERERERERDP